MKVAVVGATGMVGTIMLKVLAERQFPVTELIPVASKNSVGKVIAWLGQSYRVNSLEEALNKKPDLALFSAGGSCSLEWAPKFAAVGTTVIDNSSAWRMKAGHKLIVPEINADQLTASDKIIANPNCSTIQMVLALNPLHQLFGLERVIVSTYQSITGTGVKAMQQLENEEVGTSGEMAYPYPIYRNCLPHCDDFTSTGYTKEEMKLVHETRKIIGDKNIGITATAVRIPVMGGHSESINVTFKKDFDMSTVRKTIHESEGLVLQDNTDTFAYPMPKYAEGKDAVFVGRLRRDESFRNTLNMWVVSDNLRKGAATNAIQIAESLLGKGYL
jgi:aspartate-semialdehyde dehydrogenase